MFYASKIVSVSINSTVVHFSIFSRELDRIFFDVYPISAQSCIPYRNPSFDLPCKSNGWFLYEMEHWLKWLRLQGCVRGHLFVKFSYSTVLCLAISCFFTQVFAFSGTSNIKRNIKRLIDYI